MDVPANILKHLFGSKYLIFLSVTETIYDFETMFSKLDEAKLKLEELRKQNDHSK